MFSRELPSYGPAGAALDRGAGNGLQTRSDDGERTVVASLWDCRECRSTVRVFSKPAGAARAMAPAECPRCGGRTIGTDPERARGSERCDPVRAFARASRDRDVAWASPYAA
jgi:hypothetical protein